jgi:hypothetical protein
MVTRVAMVFGIVFLLLGILGLVATGGMSMAADPAPAMVLGMFPVNLLHNIVHLAFGVWGLLAARSFAGAKMFAQVAGVVYLVLACIGFFAPTGLGFVPLGGNIIWLHAAIGLVLAGIGFTAKQGTTAAPAGMGARM